MKTYSFNNSSINDVKNYQDSVNKRKSKLKSKIEIISEKQESSED
jgi:hypothetical protein